jgi:hypothetical protein
MPEVDETTQAEPAPKPVHEHRYEHKHEDLDMGINEQLDKININMPGADGGMGGVSGILAAMMANKDQGGMGTMWPILLLLLLRRGGLEGDVGAVAATTGVDRCEITAILSKLGDLQAAGPLSTAQIETFLATQTGQISNQINQQSLFISQGFANLGDKVTNSATAVLAAGQASTNQILVAIQGVKDQATQFEMSTLQRQLAVADSALLDERHSRRSRDVEVNVTQQVNQQQQQAQFQAQIGGLLSAVQGLMLQNSRQAQDIVNLGTMTASGTQAAANTQVR